MNIIQNQNHLEFHQYLKETRNTICGRHPIGILLALIENSKLDRGSLLFLDYSQSTKVISINDSSVSYASAYYST